MAGKVDSKGTKSNKVRKSLLMGVKLRKGMKRLLQALKLMKKEEVPVEVIETRLTKMLSASNNNLLSLDSTMAGARLLTPRAQRQLLGL